MTKTSRNTASATEQSFHRHYAAIWGQERWENRLYPALSKPTRHSALVNRYASTSGFHELLASFGIVFDELQKVEFPNLRDGSSSEESRICCFSSEKEGFQFPPPALATSAQSTERLMTHWALDAASALAAYLLDVQPLDRVLDLSAAPGGKSVALAQNIWPMLQQAETSNTSVKAQHISLCSNEYDTTRYKRLSENLKSYLPSTLFKKNNVMCTHLDGTDPLAHRKLSPGQGAAGYDKVLIDAPCSSERHIIHAHLGAVASGRPTAPEMANWRPGSSKRLQKTQLELLQTGLKAARIGGTVMYATCSLETGENDGVVEKALAWAEKEVKKGARWTVKLGFKAGEGNARLEEELDAKWAERTKYGWIVLPDHPSGGRWGPLFFCLLTKAEVT